MMMTPRYPRPLASHAVLALPVLLLCALSLTLVLRPSPAYAATITVTTDSDVVANNFECSLREAIINANNNDQSGSTDCLAGSGPDTIAFSIGFGERTITLGSALPAITEQLTIDGTSQGGAVGGGPRIVLDGSAAGTGVDGLAIAATASNSFIVGLTIVGFDGDGITILADNVIVQGNYIGILSDGTTALGNGGAGLRVETGATGALIGGDSFLPGVRNVISGNVFGIVVESDGNTIQGNYIGTNDLANDEVPNTSDGILVTGTGNTIGGLDFFRRNLVSGNGSGGAGDSNIEIVGNNNTLTFNDVGTNNAGTEALVNGGDGIILSGSGNTVGGSTDRGNLIAGNDAGVLINGDGNVVLGNRIGTNFDGTSPIGNSIGVYIFGGGNTIGDTGTDEGNIISGNGTGIEIDGTGNGSNNVIQSNLIGLAGDGSSPIGNSGAGIFISTLATNNLIGGTDAGARNVISFNADGIVLESGGNTVQGNYIGLDTSGTTAAGNTNDGIRISSDGNTIGGATAAARNVIAGNGQDGDPGDEQIEITGSSNIVRGNYIGTDASGLNGLFSSDTGIFLGGTDNTAGGDGPGEGNLIAGHDFNIVAGGTGHTIQGNLIGTDVSGNASIFSGSGIFSFASDSTIGGTTAGARNVIAGHIVRGIVINGSGGGGANNLIQGNYIGLGADGATDLGNGNGVEINVGASGNTVGGTTAGARNVIAGNTSNGVAIASAGTENNTILGNYVGLNAAGTAAVPNGIDGVFIFSGAANNTVGGTTAGARNILSGNGDDGLEFENAGTGNRVIGNYVGTNPAGTAAIPNLQTGIQIINSPGSLIGGSAAGEGNLVSGNVDRGLIITTEGATVQGNLIGTDLSGNTALGNGTEGIFLAGDNNLIGGTTAGARNVIAASGQEGILVTEASTDANSIVGNYIGLGADGVTDLGNALDGILITNGATNSTIGSSDSAGRNVISGNGGAGIAFRTTATPAGGGSVIVGNYIGLAADGVTARGNSLAGVLAENVSDVTIGGVGAGQANSVANNGLDGVGVAGSSTSVAIRGNSIYANGDLGIDLDPDGPNTNDPDDADAGANFGQNFPGISAATINGSNQLVVEYSLDSLITNSAYPIDVDFYEADGGQGRRYLGSDVLAAPGEDTANLGTASELGIDVGDVLIATASDANGNTSEFSAGATVSGPDAPQSGPIFTVNSTADPGDGTCTVADCTLREAIVLANTTPNGGSPDQIRFDIPGAGPHSIRVVDPGLPAITQAVIVDGSSQPGFAGIPLIEIEGSLITRTFPGFVEASGLLITSGGSTVQGLAINRFTENGITVRGAAADGNTIRGNYVGLGLDGTTSYGVDNNIEGISLENGADNNLVGGTSADDRNVISGNRASGVTFDGDTAPVSGNRVVGNYLGTNAAGTSAVANFLGVSSINDVSGNVIGGDTPAERNVISGNNTGVSLLEGTTTVQGNYIGLGPDGSTVLANSNQGMLLSSGGNLVGGSNPGEGNVISGNGGDGIMISGGAGNTIQGNLIGTDATGQFDRGNGSTGIYFNFGGSNTTIGGTTTGARNLIAGNAGDGVGGLAFTSGGDSILGNFIGVAADGTTALGNDGNGVALGNNNLTIGGLAPGAGNLIANNGGAGVTIFAQNTLVRGNRIFNNAGLGIDIDGDGVTPNDAGDGDSGSNGLQNFPVVVQAVPASGGATVRGRLNSTAGASFDLDFYTTSACDASGYGEGATYRASLGVTTDTSGEAIFNLPLASFPATGFVVATATGPEGTSEFSLCAPIGPANDSWTRALPIPLSNDPLAPSGEASQFLAAPGQTRWYTITVPPESRILLTLSGLPANYDLALYSDIAQAYDTLEDTVDLALIDAEFDAGDQGAEEAAPNELSPETLSPLAYSEEAFDPVEFSPSVIDTLAAAPRQRAPRQRAPRQRAPIPPQELPADLYGPGSFDPAAPSFDPDRFVGAQARSLLAASINEGTADEQIAVNSWSRGGTFYLRVTGRNAAFSLAQPFQLDVQLLTGACGTVDTPTGALPTANSGSYSTIILTDLGRVPGTSTERATLSSRLATFAARPEVQGVIVNVGDALAFPRVAQARAESLANAGCPFAMNQLAGEIKAIVEAYRAQNPLAYVVIVGNDDVIPFFRYPDAAGLGNETDYVPPVFDETTSQANLRLGYFLGQDAYGARYEVNTGPSRRPVPDMPVGRLVETASEATGMLDAYLGANGQAGTPDRAVVTGYDFLSDAAVAISSELRLGLGNGATINGLIADPTLSPDDPSMWTASQLRNLLLDNSGGDGFDLAYLAGHFDANGALAADYETVLQARVLAESTTVLTNAIVFSNGCHAGYNLVDTHAVISLTDELDWAQAFAQKGATLIAGSGYQFGDTELIEYGERLYLNFAQELRVGTPGTPVEVGRALYSAKQRYLADTPQPYDAHDKTVQTVALYGLPMLRLTMPDNRFIPPVEPSAVPSTAPFTSVAGDPGDVLGLRFADLSIPYAPVTRTQTLTNLTPPPSTLVATYLEGPDGLALAPAEPLLPLDRVNVSQTDLALRGVGFRGGSYEDVANILPLISAAATEIRGVQVAFPSPTFYPGRIWSVNYYDALARPNGATRLMFTPAQFRTPDPTQIQGILRRYDDAQFRLFYSDNIASYGGNIPALADPPAIVRVESTLDGNLARFRVFVTGDPSAGIQAVWLTYTGDSGALVGEWVSLDLQQDPNDSTLWLGQLDLSVLGALGGQLSFMAQAVNGVGLVTLDDNEGLYYQLGIDPASLPDSSLEPTTLVFQSPATTGVYGTQQTFRAALSDTDGPLANQSVIFSLGGQAAQALTDGSGVAEATLPLLSLPGDYELHVAFSGDVTFQASSASAPFRITRQATSLTLSPTAGSITEGTAPPLIATLSDASGRALKEQTLVFVLTASGNSVTRAVITDFAGRASLAEELPEGLPAGSYSVEVFFGGNPVPGLTLDNPRYEPSSASGTLTVTPVALEPVSPVLECVFDRGKDVNPRYLARFGYNNPNAVSVTIPVGSDNRFTPNPQDRGQPTTFLPGRQRFVFDVPFQSGNQVWTLNGRTSTASPSSSKCSQGPQLTLPSGSVKVASKLEVTLPSTNLGLGDWQPIYDQNPNRPGFQFCVDVYNVRVGTYSDGSPQYSVEVYSTGFEDAFGRVNIKIGSSADRNALTGNGRWGELSAATAVNGLLLMKGWLADTTAAGLPQDKTTEILTLGWSLSPIPTPIVAVGPQDLRGTLYRAVQGHSTVTQRVVIERNIAMARFIFGFSDFDSNVAGDGWALVGRTNGSAANGTLFEFRLDGALDLNNVNALVPRVRINGTSQSSPACITTSPLVNSLKLSVVKKGQTRIMEPPESRTAGVCVAGL
jgi:CSLREA domain-containing protein